MKRILNSSRQLICSGLCIIQVTKYIANDLQLYLLDSANLQSTKTKTTINSLEMFTNHIIDKVEAVWLLTNSTGVSTKLDLFFFKTIFWYFISYNYDYILRTGKSVENFNTP